MILMMKKKPTYNQRKWIERNKLDPKKWYIQKDTPEFMQIVHVDSQETRTINKS